MYLDPGFGSMVIQVIVATIAAVGAVFFTMKTKFKNIFTKKNVIDKKEVQDATKPQH